MTPPLLSISNRTRRTPFSRRVEAAGVTAYTVYNHMLLPTVFESVEADYHHLRRHVQVWDVACERQVEIRGRDAGRLAQLLTPRDLSRMADDQCFYTPMLDETGGMINDPVMLRPRPGCYWVSVADSDALLWIKGFAAGLGLEVEVDEPDVSPLAVQGPDAVELVSRVFGDAVRGIGFFRFRRLPFADTAFVVARSGYSKQGGFEIYVEGAGYGEPLWDALFDAAHDLDARAGCPNLIERIEGGLLSYGNDMTREHTPHECALERFCDIEAGFEFIGRERLLARVAGGPARQIRGVWIDGEAVPPCTAPWPLLDGTRRVGAVTSAAWSPRFRTNVAIGMVDRSHWNPGTAVAVEASDTVRTGTVASLPFRP